MSLIPDDVIDQVREAADLVGIIGESVELKRAGADYRGPCPFHGGTHRNFAVIPKKGMFYCFVCHEAGDVFTYFMKRFGMDYPTAVREVARRTGITIPERGPAGPDPHEPLFAAVAAAQDWFARQLRESPDAEPARAYLKTRGLDQETANLLGLGFAPRGTAFLNAMEQLGVREADLAEAGLVTRRDDGTLAPRFRGRVLFPIHDLRGRVVAFGGRILGEGEPKYLNSPETPIFHKGRQLYNLYAAKQAIRTAERAVLVEGYFDVIRLVLAGIEEVIAPLGTGLTPEQSELLARYTAHVILLYDSDEPGLRATFRAGDELLRHGLRVSVATLPAGDDPDTLAARGGAAAVEALFRDAVDVFDRKIQILERKGMLATLPGRRRALDGLLPTIRAARDPITRELYLSRAAEATGVRKDALERELAELGRDEGMGGALRPAATPGSAGVAHPPSPRHSLEPGGAQSPPDRAPDRSHPLPPTGERTLLALLLSGEPWRARVLEAVDETAFEFAPYRQVFVAEKTGSALELDGTAARAYEEIRGEGVADGEADALFDRAVGWIEARRLDRQLAEIDRQLPLANGEEQVRLVREKQRLAAERNRRFPKYKVTTRRGSASGS